ncbi:MAG: tetratricopeptide repeat protein [Sedimentisphaerales bacterium]|nr:tetratricopeptide repeat protein [Sedimentisphaerales bacterium]
METSRQFLIITGVAALVVIITGCDPGISTAGNSFDAVNYNRRAQVFFNNGDLTNAKEELRLSLDADYENPVSHYYLGKCFQAENNLEKAVYEYRLAVRFAPSMELAQTALIETLEIADQHEESLDCLKNWLNHAMMELLEYQRIGAYFNEANMSDHAVLTWEAAVKAYPHNAEPCLSLADFYRDRNMKSKEIEWLTRAARANPFHPGLARRLGENNLRLNIPEPQKPEPTPSEKRLRELEL